MSFKKISIVTDENVFKELDKEVEEFNKNNTGKPITRNWLIGQILKDHIKANEHWVNKTE